MHPTAHDSNPSCSHGESDGKKEQKSLNVNKQEATSKCEPAYESQVNV